MSLERFLLEEYSKTNNYIAIYIWNMLNFVTRKNYIDFHFKRDFNI